MWRMKRKKEEKEAAGEQDISTKIPTHVQALQCISEVMKFVIDSNSSRLLESSISVLHRPPQSSSHLSTSHYVA
jgi:hypothetical protein